jgi:signal recognition particle subunit SRP54
MALEALKDVVRKITRSTRVDRQLVEEVVRDIQRALLKADVNVRQVKEISDAIKKRALSEEVLPALNAREHIIKIVYEELMHGIGEGLEIPLKPSKIMLVGLQGSGKTTTAAKIAKYFKDRGMKTAVVAADTWRAAAYEQLKQLADAYGIGFYGEKNGSSVNIAKNSLNSLKSYEIIVIDTAGRHALEKELIDEMVEISEVMQPDYKLLVVDAAIGQLASKQAKAFHAAIGINAIVITKFDGTAKGGGALSTAREIGIPIAFIGSGEKVEDFERFDPAGFVSRLLGMGDIKALLEKVERVVAQEELDPEAFLKGTFTLKDVYKQLEAMKKMGPISKIFEMLPFGFGGLKVDENTMEITQDKMKKFKVIMDSMTEEELLHPRIIDSSRVRRIAIGSGTTPQEVKELLKYYKTMKGLMKKMRKGKFGRLPVKLPKMGF